MRRVDGGLSDWSGRRCAGRRCDCPIVPIRIVNEFVDAEGNTLRWEDADGKPMPGPPVIPSCRLCKGQVKYVAVVRRPTAERAPSLRKRP